MPLRDLLVVGLIFGSLPVCVARPWGGVLIYTWMSLMNPHRYAGTFAVNFPVAMLPAVATLVGLALTRDRGPFPRGPHVTLLALLWGYFCFTTVFAINQYGAWDQLEKVSKVLFMVFVTLALWIFGPLATERAAALPADYSARELFDKLYTLRSAIPAVSHVDFSARVQTVTRESNERFWRVLSTFRELTGCPLLVNTSFNVKDEPSVCTPDDAVRCFQSTGIDALVMGNWLCVKENTTQARHRDK